MIVTAVDPPNIKRRLTCILATDAVGYSSHMARDEDGTIRILAAHRAVIDGIIAFHEGRIISTAGDSVLAEFGSAVSAVRCAIEMQDALRTRNDALPEDRRLLFRVGVNLGDVVVKNQDLLGDGVNVAARLESIAEPGGICISSSVYDQITGKLDLGFTDIGEQNLKNISRPIRAYRVSGTSPVGRTASAPPAKKPDANPSSARWIPMVAIVAIGVAGAIAWRGMSGDEPARQPATAPASPPPGAATPSTADIDKARAETDALRRQAEEDLARARADAEAARLARQKADADAQAARIRAQAESDAARIRAEAQKLAAKPQPSVPVVRPPGPSAPPTREPASAPVAVASAPAPAPAIEKPERPPAFAVTTAFDGVWRGLVTCTAHADGAAGYRKDFLAIVKEGYLRGRGGEEDEHGSIRIEGQIQPDGSATLSVRGRTADPKFTVDRLRPGSPYAYKVDARFEATKGYGRRVQLRACDLTFVKG